MDSFCQKCFDWLDDKPKFLELHSKPPQHYQQKENAHKQYIYQD